MSELKGISEGVPKPQVKPETWIRWSKSVYNALKVHKSLKALYEATDAEKIPRRRVQSILAILQGLGLVEIRDDEVALIEVGEGLEAAALRKEAMELRRRLEEANAEAKALSEKIAGLEGDLKKLKAGLSEVDCAFLQPLGMVGASGQNLYHCIKRGLTMGEKAGVCLACDLRTPRGAKPKS